VERPVVSALDGSPQRRRPDRRRVVAAPNRSADLSDGNSLIHQATRLKIMAALNRLHADAALEFTSLKAILQTTDGNLGTHLEALERAGYVASEKRFVGRKPQTRVKATPGAGSCPHGWCRSCG